MIVNSTRNLLCPANSCDSTTNTDTFKGLCRVTTPSSRIVPARLATLLSTVRTVKSKINRLDVVAMPFSLLDFVSKLRVFHLVTINYGEALPNFRETPGNIIIEIISQKYQSSTVSLNHKMERLPSLRSSLGDFLPQGNLRAADRHANVAPVAHTWPRQAEGLTGNQQAAPVLAPLVSLILY